MKIRIEKLARAKDGLPAMPMEQHLPGMPQPFDYSLPISYWVEGVLIFPVSGKIEVGGSVCIRRHIRNGVAADGYLETTKVLKVTEDTFETTNSIYKYRFL